MKRSLLLMVLVILAVGGTCSLAAAKTEAVPLSEQDPIELSLEQAVAMALKQNLDLYLKKIDLEQDQAELDRAIFVGDEDMIETARTKLEQAQQNYSTARRDLVTEVRTKYYELLQQEASVQNQAQALERAKTQLEIDQARFEAGMISTLDLQRINNSLLDAEHSYESALFTLDTKYLEFGRTLGLELGMTIVLTDQINVDFVPFDLELEQAYQLALNHDQGVKTANEALTKAIDAVKAADNPYTPRVELEKAKVEQEKAEIKLKQAELTLYFRIRDDFNKIKNAAANVLAKERELELEQQSLKAEETKYAAGVISNQAVVAQQEKLAKAEDAYTQALWNYSQMRNQFLITLGMVQDLSGGVDDGK
ncbi:MAG TPA: TolC family protein [Firmicutes bacterium]|nr:TolC family protein [Bacillota bacterium]